jgi:acetylornithine deacetylase/succinyl-diaminopimelate desuccinylase-like protein
MQCIIRLATLILIGLAALPAGAADFRAQVQHYRLAHEAAIVGELTALTRLKSVAADPAGIAATAHALEDALKQRGFEVSELSTGSGSPPAVFGALKVPNAKRTVVFYAHYDGQPVTPSQWSSDPFQPVMREHALTGAASKAAGAPVVVLPMAGGSVPLYMFADVFSAPIICLPIVNHDNNQHAANENLRLQNLWDGIDTYAALMAELNW